MNLDKSYQISEIVASVAIIISLVYLAMQIQQNTQAIRLTAGNHAAEQAKTLFVVSADPEHRELVYRAWQDPESVQGIDRFGFFGIMHGYFRTLENVYYQQVDGILDPRLWDGLYRSIRFLMTVPGVQFYWNLRQDWYSDEFRSFINITMEEGQEASFSLGGN